MCGKAGRIVWDRIQHLRTSRQLEPTNGAIIDPHNFLRVECRSVFDLIPNLLSDWVGSEASVYLNGGMLDPPEKKQASKYKDLA